MKKLLALSAAVSAALTSVSATASDDAGAFYISPMAQYSLLDKDRIAKDDFGAQFGVGMALPHGLAVEADYSRATFDVSGTSLTQRLSVYSADIIKKFFPEWPVQPYALVGGGLMQDTLTKYPHKFQTYEAEAGLGVLYG